MPSATMLSCQKHLFSIPTDRHYLNCAYMSPLSKRVEAAGREGIHRKAMPADITPDDFFSGPNRVRELFAGLIGCADPARIALIPAVSYGTAVVARNTPVSAGQNVVTLHAQFPSHVYAWRRLCDDRDATVRVVSPPDTMEARGSAWNEALLEAIDTDTALVAIPPVHWTDGTVFDLDEVGRRARGVGAALVIDGSQSIGARPFDLRFQPDAVLCAAYKWLGGPYGIGVAYFGPRYDDGVPLEETWIGRAGSEDFNKLVDYQDDYRSGAARYDVGEHSNFVLVPMLISALEQLAEWGVTEIAEYCRGLTAGLLDDVRDAGYGVTESGFRSDHLFGLRLPEAMEMGVLRDALDRNRVSISLRGNGVRVSPNVYNDAEDIDALRAALGL